MAQGNVFRWRDGEGWLILAGSGSPGSEVESNAIQKAFPGKPVVYIWAASDADSADQHLSVLDDLGASTGYLLDVNTEDDQAIHAALDDAGLIILGDGPDISALRGGLAGVAIESIEAAYQEGATVLAIGVGAAILGSRYLNAQNEIKTGLSWLEQSFIVPSGIPQTTISEHLKAEPNSYSLMIGSDSALAFGPDGEVEVWGARQIRVTFGSNVIQGE